MEGGQERWLPDDVAVRMGYAIVDLSDDWTPFLFNEQHRPTGEPLPNRYRRVFVGLANETLDEDGQSLPKGEKRYLELYGIPPSISVLRGRFLEDAARPCHDAVDWESLQAVESIAYISPERIRAEDNKLRKLESDLEKDRRKGGHESLDALALADPKAAAKLSVIRKREAEKQAMAMAEKRLACAGFLTDKSNHRPGVYDDAMRLAVRGFQQKHMIYEGHYLRRQTMETLSRPPLESEHKALLRALRERVVDAAGIIEDGTTQTPDLAEQYTQAVAEQLGLSTPEGALAFLKKHPASDFVRLRAAVKLPPPPSYHGPHMDLSIEIDRGDIWYDPPFDDTGAFKLQPRRKFPHFVLYARHEGKRIALVRWRTTIGGWRAEQASDGYEYFRYKGSDVGPRVIRQIIAGPVWIAPASTPIRSLMKTKYIGGRRETVVNYNELGPGYLSAYGLVAGYFVVPGLNGRPDWDNGIRAHGSSDYLSIYSSSGYSHGCHRLPNHLAIRLYSFILRHRNNRVAGDQSVDFGRQFLWKDDIYEMRIPSRGYAYVLDPPLPVMVHEGDVKGEVKKPILTYVPKPGTIYPGPPPPVPNSPEARAGGVSTEGAGTAPETPIEASP